jgi:lysyl-tRNA synthetase, class II
MSTPDAADPNAYRAARSANAARLRALGHDPFGQRYETTHTCVAARALAGLSAAGPHSEPVRLAGRIGNLRNSGKLVFATLYDRSRGDAYRQQSLAGRADIDGAEGKKERGIQLFIDLKTVGEEGWKTVEALDLADWIGVEGRVGRTRRGEISLFVSAITALGKAMLPPPHQAGADAGDLSEEVRSRQRYLDLMQSDASLDVFITRSRLVSEMRRFFTDRGFLEVETPMMQPIPGGAAARPFVTHHNALDLDLYLRVAPELYLKRLLVGGLERVFELNRNFRNEGISPRHNPEFTMIEWYMAYADHRQLMDLSEELLRSLADRVLGTRKLAFGGHAIDLDRPFRRFSYHDAMHQLGGVAYDDRAAVEAQCRAMGRDPRDFPTYDRMANAVWEHLVEPHLVEPTFITDQPTWLTPLCKSHPDDPARTLRFELFMCRMEVGNAYTELNDPDVQRSRFVAQAAEAAAARDAESGIIDGRIDEDYCTALDHGLPACGGQGIGIDRLVMLFTGRTNIRDVILFPTLRPA